MSDQTPATPVDWHLALANYLKDIEMSSGDAPGDMSWIRSLSAGEAERIFTTLANLAKTQESDQPSAKEKRS